MTRFFNPDSIVSPHNNYSHGAEVETASRLLYMAGQVGSNKDGSIAADFETQMRQTYANIEAILSEVGMDLTNLVKVTTFLTDRVNLAAMREIRTDILGDHRPAHTLLLVAGLAYEDFLIEVECVAAAQD